MNVGRLHCGSEAVKVTLQINEQRTGFRFRAGVRCVLLFFARAVVMHLSVTMRA